VLIHTIVVFDVQFFNNYDSIVIKFYAILTQTQTWRKNRGALLTHKLIICKFTLAEKKAVRYDKTD
jgi:hypothetical protein